MIVTPHALERFRIHHPTAEVHDLQEHLRWGREVTPEFAQAMTGRARCDKSSRYFLAPTNRGMFVICKSNNVVITYLRFQEQQRRILEPTTRVPAALLTSKAARKARHEALLAEQAAKKAERLQKLAEETAQTAQQDETRAQQKFRALQQARHLAYLAELEQRYAPIVQEMSHA